MNKPANKNGFERCRVAFERLKAGEPLHPAHKGLAPYKVTPAVVSVEAGFDPGYLKKSRAIHASLIDEINRFRRANKPDSSVNLTRLNKALKKIRREGVGDFVANESHAESCCSKSSACRQSKTFGVRAKRLPKRNKASAWVVWFHLGNAFSSM